MARPKSEGRTAFARFAAAGILFQGGAATVDTSTIVAALVHGLTGSPLAVGAAAAISRYGWLFPQIFVAHLAQGRPRRMPFYKFGAFGRAICLVGLAGLLWFGGAVPGYLVPWIFFVLWTIYACVSGVVAVPYNDIVARSIPSGRRSRLLAVRFFGGGLVALMIAALAYRVLDLLPFPQAYGGIFLLGAALLFGSATFFVFAGEPPAPVEDRRPGFGRFLLGGLEVVRNDRRFSLFLGAQWLGGMVTMALPFYILQAQRGGMLFASDVAILVGAQTAGALLSNPLWGWWGDRRGKLSLLGLVAALGAVAPALTLVWLGMGEMPRDGALVWFGLVFFLLGAEGNGRTIAYLGYLMEISPDGRRPAYSGYFNALVAPASLFPIAAAAVGQAASFTAVFGLSLVAAGLQLLALRRLAGVTSDTKVRP